MKRNLGITGEGHVGSALRSGLERAGYDVRAAGEDPAAVRDVGAWADAIVLAVPFAAVGDAVRELGDGASGKPLVDATNSLTSDMQLAAQRGVVTHYRPEGRQERGS